MSQKKRVGPSHTNITGRRKVVPHVKAWYCCECEFGPLSDKLDIHCTICGKQRCTFCREEWVPVGGRPPFSVPRSKEPPRLEALPTASHVIPHNCSRRAATPFDDTGSVISSIELRLSPLPPYPPYPTGVIGTGTDISTDTHPETSAQQSSQLALEQWNVSGSEINLVPVPIHEPFRLFSSVEVPSYNDTRSRLHGSPQDPSSLCQLTTQFDFSLAPGPDYSIQHTSGTARSVVGALKDIQHPPPRSRPGLKRKHVAVDNTSADASAPNSETQPAQKCAVPMLPSRLASSPVSPGWSEFPVDDGSIQCHVDSQIPTHSVRSTPLSWVPSGDYSTLSLSPPWGPELLNITDLSQEDRTPHGISRHDACCKSKASQRFACPFYKYDPTLYFGCVLRSFRCIGHMKQHLKKIHKLGPNHCKFCWRTFDTTDSLTDHAQGCKTATGGVPVHDLPAFPRIRLTSEKKWYWGWKKLFGEAAAPPPSPYSHPLEDLQVQFRVQSPDMCRRIIRDEENESPSYVDFAEEEEGEGEEETNEHSLFTSPDWRLTDNEAWLTITGPFAGIASRETNLSSSCPTVDTSLSPQSLDFSFET